MKEVVKKSFTCNNSDLNVIGVELGYGWNQVCDWIREYQIYGQDGCGYYYLSFEDFDEGYFESPDIPGIHKILYELLKQSDFEDILITDW